ncbi:hypothetical protein BN874_240004 [Candidatus Contendobacter odensis Run_B_J11]|uniref:Uncharacterized protein n=1 Tax=Candidatus Contendobacter odensis Run_B_J11 TaxID=1400861 RepID=A0A7U7GCA5_9GAMM|nr:hypothetical protein BN874_240004 [Candidatus Contendobacter odensis Run_B_J11]
MPTVVLSCIGAVALTLENEWGDRTPRTQIVAIGSISGIDGEVLQGQFDRCPSDKRGK